jgi:hypothetical protein
MTVQGNVLPVELDVPAYGAFSPLSVSCAVASGDIAVEGRQLQAEAGMATTVTGPFTAQRVAPPDLGADFEEQFVQLVLQAEALIAAALPEAQHVVDRVRLGEQYAIFLKEVGFHRVALDASDIERDVEDEDDGREQER